MHNLPLFKPSLSPTGCSKTPSLIYLLLHSGLIPTVPISHHWWGTTWNSLGFASVLLPSLKLLCTGSSSWNAFSPPHSTSQFPTSPGSLQCSSVLQLWTWAQSPQQKGPYHSRRVISNLFMPAASWLYLLVNCTPWLCQEILALQEYKNEMGLHFQTITFSCTLPNPYSTV